MSSTSKQFSVKLLRKKKPWEIPFLLLGENLEWTGHRNKEKPDH